MRKNEVNDLASSEPSSKLKASKPPRRPSISSTDSIPLEIPLERFNDSIEEVQEDENRRCEHCGMSQSPIWRLGLNKDVLCNACGLYLKHHHSYRPLIPEANRRSIKSKEIISPTLSISEPRRIPERESRRRNKNAFPGSQFIIRRKSRKPLRTFRTSSIEKLYIPYGTLLKSKIQSLENLDYSGQTSIGATFKYALIRGLTIFQGDYVAIRADNEQLYFVVIKDIKMDGLMFNFAWLVPRVEDFERTSSGEFNFIDPGLYEESDTHGDLLPLDSILFVWHSPCRTPKPLPDPLTLELPMSDGDPSIYENLANFSFR